MPNQQLPSKLCSYIVHTGIVRVDIQQGLGKLKSEPGAGNNVFANLAVFDLPPNNGTKLGVFSCDLSDYRQKDVRRYFMCSTGDAISIIVDERGKPRYFYNHVTESYGIYNLWSFYRTGDWKRNIFLYVMLLVVIMVIPCCIFGTSNTVLSNCCFLTAYFLPLLPYIAAQVIYCYHISFIEWVMINCVPEQTPQSALQTHGI